MKKRPHSAELGPLQFVTVTTYKRIPLFRSPTLCQEFLATLAAVKNRFPFEIFAYALLPDHFHLLLRAEDGNTPRLMQKIKSLAARAILQKLQENDKKQLLAKLKRSRPGRRAHTYRVFQDSFRTLALVSPWMIKQKIDYIHKNPVKDRLAENSGAYPWSSCRAIYEGASEPLPLDPLPL